MTRIAADHPTGFELVRVGGARAARRLSGRRRSRAAGTARTWSPTRRSCRARRTTAASTSCSSATSTRPAWARATAPRCSAARSRRPGRCTRREAPSTRLRLQTRALAGRERPGPPALRARPRRRPAQLPDVLRPDRVAGARAAGRPRGRHVRPGDRRGAAGRPQRGVPRLPQRHRRRRGRPGTASWSARPTPATTSRSCCATRRAGDRVAAYVFAHEYALAPSGEQGREAYVAYVGTLPAHRGRGLATHLLAHTLHACRAAGFDTSSLDVDTAEPDGGAGHLRACGLRRALPPGQLRARGGAGRVDQVRPVAGALPGVQRGLVVQPLLPVRRASARRHGRSRVAAARRGEPRPTRAWSPGRRCGPGRSRRPRPPGGHRATTGATRPRRRRASPSGAMPTTHPRPGGAGPCRGWPRARAARDHPSSSSSACTTWAPGDGREPEGQGGLAGPREPVDADQAPVAQRRRAGQRVGQDLAGVGHRSVTRRGRDRGRSARSRRSGRPGPGARR